MVISYFKDAASALSMRNTYPNTIILQYAFLVAADATKVW